MPESASIDIAALWPMERLPAPPMKMEQSAARLDAAHEAALISRDSRNNPVHPFANSWAAPVQTPDPVDADRAVERWNEILGQVDALFQAAHAETGWRPLWMNLNQYRANKVTVHSMTIERGGQTKLQTTISR